ncbi:MAG TPA: polysaccharide deacetylase family protein [Streptosporangiaceae bacterium]|nr:polysaccharide deacetylase family protein [Streptosporangiaceae bacterium]
MSRGSAALATGAVIGALGVAHAGPGLTALRPVRNALFPRLAGLGRNGHVALTFDDGPDPGHTPALLDLLAARGVQATFFLLGSMVARAPGLAAEISAAGHELSVHGWAHRYTITRSPWVVRDDLVRAWDAVGEASNSVPRWYRPPYGVLSTGAITASRSLGLTPVLWTCWGREWVGGATPETVHQTLAKDLGPGATVLLHDSDCTSPPGSAAAALGALPKLLDDCEAHGWQVGPLAHHGL